MDFSNIFSSIKRQFVVNKPNVTDSKENVTPLGTADNSSNGKSTCDMDESYLVVNSNLDVEVMLQNEPALVLNDRLLSSTSPPSEGPSLQDSNSALNQKSAISDVPFHLHNSIVTQQQINSLFSDTPLTYQTFDWMKYSVDFCNERAVISGYNVKQE